MNARCQARGLQRKIQQSPCSLTSLANRASHKGTLSRPSSFVPGITATQHIPDMTTIYKLVSHTLYFSVSSKRAENILAILVSLAPSTMLQKVEYNGGGGGG